MQDALTTDHEMVRGRAALLAGDPIPEQQWRGESWEIHLPSPAEIEVFSADESPEAAMLHDARAIPYRTSTANVYDPVREMPTPLDDFAELGEKVWGNGMTWNSALGEDTVRLLRLYGPLRTHRADHDKSDSIHEFWAEARRLSLAILCVRVSASITSTEYATTVDRIVDTYHHDAQHVSPRLASHYEESEVRWKRYRQTFDLDDDRRVGNLNDWLSEAINTSLIVGEVFSQTVLSLGSGPPTWRISYRPRTLLGALWSEVAGIVLSGERVERCKFLRCPRSFRASPKSKQLFCSRPCKEADRKRRDRV